MALALVGVRADRGDDEEEGDEARARAPIAQEEGPDPKAQPFFSPS
jgi:hypothetical protein